MSAIGDVDLRDWPEEEERRPDGLLLAACEMESTAPVAVETRTEQGNA
jgi:hypothetical protein